MYLYVVLLRIKPFAYSNFTPECRLGAGLVNNMIALESRYQITLPLWREKGSKLKETSGQSHKRSMILYCDSSLRCTN